MRDEFSTFDISKALEIPKGRLREWIVNDYVKPTVPADGPGTRAVFTRDDVYAVELFRHLIDWGLKRDIAGGCLRYIKDWEVEPHGEFEVPTSPMRDEGSEPFKWMGLIIHFEDNRRRGHLVYGIHGGKGHLKIIESAPSGKKEDLYWDKLPMKDKPKNQVYYLEHFLKGKREDWSQILILNFNKIRKKVDMALSGLE